MKYTINLVKSKAQTDAALDLPDLLYESKLSWYKHGVENLGRWQVTEGEEISDVLVSLYFEEYLYSLTRHSVRLRVWGISGSRPLVRGI